ncbi:hypothetical protein M427DRAFT_56544 [Gonapodya prolifera JEL478]|uniref:VWA-like protein n=1 Tax=Gonapodya prolifera (strain JEL478) TaxID=1344416 RepID=A0A139AFX3_GONPJ|nr:hypothetical protein M427DRAFT_56544 [Gonapodya prolifera JEL478]|eukprot:KXS15711.1 hypothetical protein M427DRAFT_56544 [Gonapodya prolifera JEL478]
MNGEPSSAEPIKDVNAMDVESAKVSRASAVPGSENGATGGGETVPAANAGGSSSAGDECYICLAKMQLRGGTPIFNPGCGHQLHMMCFADAFAKGIKQCGVCKKDLPDIAINADYSGPPRRAGSPNLPPAIAHAPPHHQPLTTPRQNHGHAPYMVPQHRIPNVVQNVPASTGNNHHPRHATQFTPHNPEHDDALPEATQDTAMVVDRADPQTLLRLSLEAEHVSIPGDQDASTTIACTIQAKPAPSIEHHSSRPPCDLVAVLDRSGSMAGAKLAAVKETLRFMVEEMGENDRLSLVAFCTSTEELLPLVRVTQANKQRLEDGITRLQIGGGTNIALGLRLGVDIISKRRQTNTVKAIFLMTDGQDTERQDWREAVATAAELNCPIYCFGFGRDHDSTLLSDISGRTSGSFNYAETIDTFRPAMGGALGALSSQCVQNLSLLFISATDVTITKVTSGGQACQDVIEQDGHAVSVKYADIIYDERKVVLLEAKLGRTFGGVSQPVLKIQEASFRPSDAPRESTERTHLTALPPTLEIDRTVNDGGSAARTRRRPVVREIMRVRAADAIKAAAQCAERSAYAEAKELLQPVKTDLENLVLGANENTADLCLTPNDEATLTADRVYYAPLIGDITTAINRMSSYSSYETGGGRHWSNEASTTISAQRSTNPNTTASSRHYQSITSRMYSARSSERRAPGGNTGGDATDMPPGSLSLPKPF